MISGQLLEIDQARRASAGGRTLPGEFVGDCSISSGSSRRR